MANYISGSTKNEEIDGKKKLTYEMISAALKKDVRKDFVFKLTASVLLLAFFSFAVFASTPANKVAADIVKCIPLVPIALIAAVVIIHICKIHSISQRRYSVVKDTVERVIPHEKKVYKVWLDGYHGRMQSAMYLEKTRRVAIHELDVTKYSPGDVLYLVVMKKNPNKPLLIYNANYYELEN